MRAEPRELQGEPAEHHTTPTLFPASATEASDENSSPCPNPQDEPAACEVGPPPPRPKMLYLSKDKDGHLKIVSAGRVQTQTSDIDLSLIPPRSIDLSLIPPPSDFMDEPGPPDNSKDPPPSAGIPNHKPVDVELLRMRASKKVSQESKKELPEPSSFSVSAGPLLSPPPETAEPKSPPVVAPKPKKLPANIILKSHKAAPAAESFTGHSASTSSERLLMDPQKVRIEALRKLGLLKGDEADAGPILSPKHSPKSTRSWAAPPSPVTPASQTLPTTPSRAHSPSYVALQSPGPVSPLVLSKPPVKSQPLVPVPAAFRDPDGADEVPPVKDASASSSPEPPGPGQDLGEDSVKELPAARGAPSVVGHTASKEADSRRSPPAPQHSGDSQKLPRSQGISVLICPRSGNEDERRDALKRLGLVRDWDVSSLPSMDSLHLRDLFNHLICVFGLNVEKLLCCDQPYFTVQIGKSCPSSWSTLKASCGILHVDVSWVCWRRGQ